MTMMTQLSRNRSLAFPGFVLLLFFCAGIGHAQTPNPFIHVDQFGYTPQALKVAVVSNPVVGYNNNLPYTPPGFPEMLLVDAETDQPVISFWIDPWQDGDVHAPSGDQGWWVDFSIQEDPGTYYLDDGQGNRSAAFRISPDPYQEVMQAAGRAFFYNRCGFEKKPPYADPRWADNLDFQQETQCRNIADPLNQALWKDLRGGWYDAGDYNKYVTFAHRAVHDLLWAWEEHPQAFNDEWNIPESKNSFPDILDELKWELDWLLRMIEPDGSVHIKMGSANYSENVLSPPSLNQDPRYYGPVCTSSTIAMASLLAHAAVVYRQIEGWEGYATILGLRAQACFSNVMPAFEGNTLETDCDNGSIVAGDADWGETAQWNAAITAAVHLYDLTSNEAYHDFFLEHYAMTEPLTGFWGPYYMELNSALLHYTTLPLADPDATSAILGSFSSAVNNNWNDFYGLSDGELYHAGMPDWAFHWGSNLPMAAFGTLNLLAARYAVNPSSVYPYIQRAAHHLHYFHGVNPLGMVMLSNMYETGGDFGVNQIYHTWFADGTDWDHAIDSPYGPPPGYVTGGPNKNFSVTTLMPPSGQPPMKSYLDFNTGWPDNSWEITEPAIYSQAGYIRLLARFVTGDTGVPIDESTREHPHALSLFPNPANRTVWLSTTDHPGGEIYNQYGQLLGTIPAGTTEVDLSALPPGWMVMRIGERSIPFIHQD